MALVAQATVGRRFVVVLEPGESVLDSLSAVCAANDLAQGYIPVFSGAFREARLIGTRTHILDEDEPLPDSVHVRNLEGIGSGTIATTDGALGVHLHVALGEKGSAAAATAGHLLHAVVQYPVEVVIEEVLSPRFERRSNPAAGGIPTLRFVSDPPTTHE